ncbi:zinc ribbon domain-containing protein [Pontibacillus salipaludis]|uniref:Zinc ribbon domain-containing protein n=1 Tax=Pontibacillus salipaludis TaxID=1697394 RepID=A0ABQ1Q1T2_9BACI|nr:zinc ribbon domain-containing protein [Pontibacillus salipaludis]GGD10048.1 hypothetical protein GCM10011389_16970 [Pontibacillus salipaludis]
MICTNCNHEQESGRFCGNCGFDLNPGETSPSTGSSQPTASATATVAPSAPNENVERAKALSKGYLQEVMGFVKQPNQAFSATEVGFLKGVVSLAVYVVLFAITLYVIFNHLYGATGADSITGSLPFFSMVAPLTGNFFLVIAGSALCLFVIQLITQVGHSFKTFIARYGGILAPFMMLNAISLVAGFGGFIIFSLILLMLSLSIVINLLPPIYVYHHCQRSNKADQSIYWAILAAGASILVSYIIIVTRLMVFIDELTSMFMW